MQKKPEQFHQWLKTSAGQALLSTEKNLFAPHLAKLFGSQVALIGDSLQINLLNDLPIKERVLVSHDNSIVDLDHIQVEYPELALQPESMHVVMLPHTLEWVGKPHQLLREAEIILRPEGHLVISGFNPYSAWGIKKIFSKQGPCGAKLHALNRLVDWLYLLNFEIIVAEHQVFSGMLQVHSPWLDRCLKQCALPVGSLYFIIARKRLMGVTPQKLSWKTSPAFAKKALVNPSASSEAQHD